jgi:hypothetical protein
MFRLFRLLVAAGALAAFAAPLLPIPAAAGTGS